MKLSPKQREALALVADGKFYPCLEKEDDGWHARWRALGVENAWVDAYVREAALTRLTEDAEDQRHESLHDAWLMALKSRTGLVRWDDAECAAFAAELEAWSGSAAEDVEARRDVAFAFVPGDGPRTSFSLSCSVPRGRRRLRALGQAAYVWPPLCGLRADGAGRLSLSLAHDQAADFIHVAAPHLVDAGYTVSGVDVSAPVTATLDVFTPDARPGADAPPATRDALRQSFDATLTVRVAGEPVTAEEVRFLLDQGSTLVFFRDHWIEVDRGLLKQALRALEKGVDRRANALSFAMGLGHVGALELADVRAHGWLRGLLNEIGATARQRIGTGTAAIPGFAGTLRDYQARGVRWLRFLTDHGIGALLADDMGLGKTAQVIAWLLADRAAAPADSPASPTLVVAPLTLLANWRHELATFAPNLKVYVHQGEGRHLASGFGTAVRAADVTLTSYTLLVKDYAAFADVAWRALVLDEAQAIKNPDTQVARAVRALTPPKRVAMTGTPVENTVADVWSIEEFLNPGFLGERRSFVERFAKPIAADAGCTAARRLQYALEPFVLRRLKTDPRIAAELGDKREIREYCELTAEQRADYEAALVDFRQHERARGDIFALLTRLKLICDGEGKLERLAELLEQIFASGESALVFTQYAKVGAALRDALERRFGVRFPFLHGALAPREREAAIATFNRRGPRAFILSLKTGGFGLNLTKATHVIHFDRWWNPAVESQATDRAHRIGQAKTVFVHLFISAGTLEEHVDELLATKARVASAVITEAEWLEAAKLDE